MDLPITAREKAAIIFLLTLFVRIINGEKLKTNFYIPISKVDINFYRSIDRNAHIVQKFYFRRYFSGYLHKTNVLKDDMVEVTLEELFDGNNEFDGLKKLIEAFAVVNKAKLDNESKALGYNVVDRIWDVYNFYLDRCKGKLLSNAQFIRNIVFNHKDYKKDSMLSDQIVSDLIEKLLDVQRADYHSELLGPYLQQVGKIM